jgi:hypothetical protein
MILIYNKPACILKEISDCMEWGKIRLSRLNGVTCVKAIWKRHLQKRLHDGNIQKFNLPEP